ncbi:MAG: efflux RND transporter periplasmic adaptor subunit [Neomegalonema sp.]|nr:efflux RND transporter periplasmic adaptor subunit [Neomegalonema sp.]
MSVFVRVERTRFRAPALIMAVAAFWAGVFGGHEAAKAQRGPTGVLVDEVVKKEIREEAPIIGSLVATVDSAVATRAAGVVVKAAFKVGDIVEKGAVIVRIDDESYKIDRNVAAAAVTVAEAGLAVAKAKRARAADDLRRAEALRRSAAFSAARVEDLGHAAAEAASTEAEAAARLASAKASLARAEYFLRLAVIRAPFRGVVTSRLAQPGQYIAVGTAVARIVSLNDLEVLVDAPVERIGGLRPGVKLVIQLGTVTAPGVVRAVVPVEAAQTRTRPVRISLDAAGLDPTLLVPGASVTVMAPVSAPRTAVLAPKDALVQFRDGWMVFVAADGKAAPRPVTLGVADGDRIEIVTGLKAGELVVVRGNEGLRPNQPIAPTRKGATPAKPKKSDRS